jgi:membrane-associated phospholipid phosphatase
MIRLQTLSKQVSPAFVFFSLILCFVSRGGTSVETAGDILQFVIPASATAITLYHKDWDGALQFGESEALTLGVTYGLKYTVHERRPNGGLQSFPSGHTSVSFSAAEYLRKRYGWEYGIPAYALASFVGYSRVESGEHHPHDVIAGASIGIVSSFIFTKKYKGWEVEPEASSNYYGLRFSRAW